MLQERMQNSSEEVHTNGRRGAEYLRSTRPFRSREGKVPYVLILGSGEPAQDLVKRCQQLPRKQCRLLGTISLNGSHGAEPLGDVPLLGTSAALCDYISRNPVDIVRQEKFLGVDTTLLSTVLQSKTYLVAKRIMDLIISATALIVLAPLFLLIALAIKLSSPLAPVLYRLNWLGKNSKPIVGYKFRTMIQNADLLKEQMLVFNEMQGPVFKMHNDPRTTRLGRLLRKFSLDELPQLYSVLKGDLSLVGPRAPLREEAEMFEFWQRRKLCVKPGISCLWQINGRNEIHSFDEWVRLDLQYIETASFLLDLRILVLTIPAVLSGRGAS